MNYNLLRPAPTLRQAQSLVLGLPTTYNLIYPFVHLSHSLTTPLALLLAFTAILLLGVLLFVFFRRARESPAESLARELLENLRREMQEHRERDRQHLQERIDHVTKTLTSGIQEQFKMIQKVAVELTKVGETSKQVLSVSEQIKGLENILLQPKGRGIFGEIWLETLLSHVLQPDQYKIQYTFKNGEQVDAVIFYQDTIIPIDAKFSSEKFRAILDEKNPRARSDLEKAFRHDVKLRVDETAKYIRPEEGTTSFAFMFLPAEGIYYELLVQKVGTLETNQQSVMEYALRKHVLITSPTTFFGFLQTILQGLKTFKLQESVQHILGHVEKLGRHLNAYDVFMRKLGSNLSTTVGMYNQAYEEFRKVDRDIFKLTNGAVGGARKPLSLERPTAHSDYEESPRERRKLLEAV